MSGSGQQRYFRPAATVAFIAAVAALVFYSAIDPGEVEYAPRCIIKSLTGYDCPGCGLQRACHALLHGNFKAAWGFNPFLFFIMPVGVLYLVAEAMPVRFAGLHRVLFRPIAPAILLVVTVLWWVGRNL